MTKKFIRSLAIFLIVVLSFSFLACNGQKNGRSHFRFVYMTDVHVQPESGGAEGLKAAIKAVNSLDPKPDFVLTGGDMIKDATHEGFGRTDSLYNLFIELSNLFDMPVHYTMGNHDVFAIYADSEVDPSHPEFGKKMFMNRLGDGKTYRSFDYQNWHFIQLDGIYMTPQRKYFGKIDSVQIEWLKQDLQQVGTERPIIICTHIPFYTMFYQYINGPTVANRISRVINNAHEISKICEGYNLKAVMQGHLHIVEDLFFRNVHYITNGAVSGNRWKGPYSGFEEGFGVVDVNGDDFSWSYHTYGWDESQYQE